VASSNGKCIGVGAGGVASLVGAGAIDGALVGAGSSGLMILIGGAELCGPASGKALRGR
jgi:hypothetical protein